MKTRTLLLLALACGMAILLAGGVLLVQLAGRDDVDEAVPVGEARRIGDMEVTVESAAESAGRLEVVISIGGVEDPDGAASFRLIAAARPAERLRPEPDGIPECAATSTTPSRCRLTFDVGGADGDSRVLFYRRGDEQVRWQLDAA